MQNTTAVFFLAVATTGVMGPACLLEGGLGEQETEAADSETGDAPSPGTTSSDPPTAPPASTASGDGSSSSSSSDADADSSSTSTAHGDDSSSSTATGSSGGVEAPCAEVRAETHCMVLTPDGLGGRRVRFVGFESGARCDRGGTPDGLLWADTNTLVFDEYRFGACNLDGGAIVDLDAALTTDVEGSCGSLSAYGDHVALLDQAQIVVFDDLDGWAAGDATASYDVADFHASRLAFLGETTAVGAWSSAGRLATVDLATGTAGPDILLDAFIDHVMGLSIVGDRIFVLDGNNTISEFDSDGAFVDELVLNDAVWPMSFYTGLACSEAD